jgi:subtilase-type serine protease
MSGTSMAQPHTSGAILDILSKYPQLTHDQLVQVLKEGAVDKGAPGFDAEYGNGLINLPAALDAAEKLLAPKA